MLILTMKRVPALERSDAAFDEESASPGDATKEADIDEPIAILGTPMVARSVEWRPMA